MKRRGFLDRGDRGLLRSLEEEGIVGVLPKARRARLRRLLGNLLDDAEAAEIIRASSRKEQGRAIQSYHRAAPQLAHAVRGYERACRAIARSLYPVTELQKHARRGLVLVAMLQKHAEQGLALTPVVLARPSHRPRAPWKAQAKLEIDALGVEREQARAIIRVIDGQARTTPT